jgi:tetratricopeptide (TPR) repeat protein
MIVDLETHWFTGPGYSQCANALRLLQNYGRERNPAAFDEVMALLKSAEPAAVTRAGRAFCHFHLGQAYYAKYGVTGSLDDLTWGLRRMREAVEEDNPGHNRGDRLRLLSEALITAVEILRPGEQPAREHLVLAEKWLREALPLLPGNDAALCWLDLGLVMYQQARHFGSGQAWDAAVANFIKARGLATNDTTRAMCLGNLGKALILAYKSKPSTDLAAAIVAAYDNAAMTSPPDDPDHGVHMLQQRRIREMFKLPAADPSPWVTVAEGTRVNVLTGEVQRTP